MPSSQMPKKAGHCTLCDVQVFEIPVKNQDGVPLRIGAPYDNAWIVTFVLSSGPRMDLTFCEQCLDDLNPGIYPSIWRKVMESWELEQNDKFRKSLRVEPLSGEGKDKSKNWLAGMKNTPIIGILFKEQWRKYLSYNAR